MKYYKNIIVIGAHHDDIEMGCGGTLAKLIKNGSSVDVIILTDSEIKFKNKILRSKIVSQKEGQEGLKILGIKNIICLDYKIMNIQKYIDEINQKIIQICNKKKYDTIFYHWKGDVHPDHQTGYLISEWVGKKIKNKFQFRSNFYDSNIDFKENVYSDISKTFNLKFKAISSHRSEMKRTGGIWLKYFKHKNLGDGVKIGVKAAETFYSNKIVIDG